MKMGNSIFRYPWTVCFHGCFITHTLPDVFCIRKVHNHGILDRSFREQQNEISTSPVLHRCSYVCIFLRNDKHFIIHHLQIGNQIKIFSHLVAQAWALGETTRPYLWLSLLTTHNYVRRRYVFFSCDIKSYNKSIQDVNVQTVLLWMQLLFIYIGKNSTYAACAICTDLGKVAFNTPTVKLPPAYKLIAIL